MLTARIEWARGVVLLLAVVSLASCRSGNDEPSVDVTATSTRLPAASPTLSSPSPASNPEAVFREFVAALNRGDAAAAQALLRDDATWERGGQCPPAQCAGIARLREELDRDVAAHHRLDISSTQINGDTVEARVELQTDQTRAAGVPRVIQLVTVSLSEGKLTSVRIVNDLSDPVTAAFVGQRGGGGGNPGPR
jgi:ketosteroid isomerase-like protein